MKRNKDIPILQLDQWKYEMISDFCVSPYYGGRLVETKDQKIGCVDQNGKLHIYDFRNTGPLEVKYSLRIQTAKYLGIDIVEPKFWSSKNIIDIIKNTVQVTGSIMLTEMVSEKEPWDIKRYIWTPVSELRMQLFYDGKSLYADKNHTRVPIDNLNFDKKIKKGVHEFAIDNDLNLKMIGSGSTESPIWYINSCIDFIKSNFDLDTLLDDNLRLTKRYLEYETQKPVESDQERFFITSKKMDIPNILFGDPVQIIRNKEKENSYVAEDRLAMNEILLSKKGREICRNIRIIVFNNYKTKSINPLTNKVFSNDYYKLKSVMSKFPINKAKYKNEFIQKYNENDIILVISGTGSGKSVCLPLIVFTDILGYKGKIAMTEPRIISTKKNAEFMAKQLDLDKLDRRVGYKTGTDTTATERTLITTMVDVILLKNFFQDVEQYDCVILDEIHERSANIDFLLSSITRYLANNEPKCKFILLTATVNRDKFISYLSPYGKLGIIDIKTAVYPVTNYYLSKELLSYDIDVETKKMINNCLKTDEGDILVFIPTKKAIDDYVIYYKNLQIPDLYVGSLYSGQSKEQDDLATDASLFKEKGYDRRLIFATNVAETGITIEGMTIVIDTGTVNEPIFDRLKKVTNSKISRINKFSVIQRCGRVGRTGPGKCYHVYTEKEYIDSFMDERQPELFRINIKQILLSLIETTESIKESLDIIEHIPDKLPEMTITNTLQELYKDLLLYGDSITPIGSLIAKLHIDVDLGRLIIEAFQHKVHIEMLQIIALLGQCNFNFDSIFTNSLEKEKYRTEYGDPIAILTLMHIILKEIKKGKNMLDICEMYSLNFKIMENLTKNLKKIAQRIEDAHLDLVVHEFNLEGNTIHRILRCFSYVYEKNRIYIIKGKPFVKSGKTLIPIRLKKTFVKLGKPIIYGYHSLSFMNNMPMVSLVFKVEI